MNLRRPKIKEVKQISEVFKAVYEDIFPYTDSAEIKKDLKKDEIFSLVVEAGKEIVGFGQLRKPDYYFCNVNKAVEIARIALKPAYQNQGLGTKLIENLNKKLEADQPNYIFADVQTANCKSQKLFAKFGFKPVCCLFGLVPDFIVGNANLTIILSMKLAEEVKTSCAVYLPEEYRVLADFIYNGFSLTREVKTKSKSSKIDSSFKEKVDEHLAKAREMGQEDNYNYQFLTIDITTSRAFSKVKHAQNQGLEVEGLIPNLPAGDEFKDFLVLRKRPEQTEYDKIAVLEGVNKQLFQLVR